MATRSPFETLTNLSIMATSFIAVAISYTLRYIELESEDIEVSTRPNKQKCVFRVTRPYLRFWSRPYFFSSCKKRSLKKIVPENNRAFATSAIVINHPILRPAIIDCTL